MTFENPSLQEQNEYLRENLALAQELVKSQTETISTQNQTIQQLNQQLSIRTNLLLQPIQQSSENPQNQNQNPNSADWVWEEPETFEGENPGLEPIDFPDTESSEAMVQQEFTAMGINSFNNPEGENSG